MFRFWVYYPSYEDQHGLIKEPQPVSNKSTSVEEEASPNAPTMFVKNVALDPYGEWIVVKKKKKTSFER